MIPATIRSGQRVAVPQTPSAANITATFPIASLREHSHTERTFGVAVLVAHQQQHARDIGGQRHEPNVPITSARGTPSTST